MTCLLKAPELHAKLKRIAMQILENSLEAEVLSLVGLHSRGVPLAKQVGEILRQEGREVEDGTLDIAFYRDDLHEREIFPTVRKTHFNFPLDGRRVILFDDVIMSGRTIRAALNALLDYGRPARIELAVVIDRGGRQLPIQPDYTAHRVDILPSQHIAVQMAPMDHEDGVFLYDRQP